MDMLERPSPNRRSRPPGAAIDTLVLHYTGMRSGAAAIERLRDPAAAVSSHYVVDEDGTVSRLVPEALRAAHAGVSFWRGAHDLNDRSIGIEIVNPGHEWGYRAFPAAQIEAVGTLSFAVVSRHAIDPVNVVAHSDVAPDRKQDPGELFPWPALAALGVGVWPADADGDPLDRAPADGDALDAALDAIGYPPVAPALRIAAFQRHWRQEWVDGLPDRGTARRASGVLAQVGAWRRAAG